MEHHLQDHLPHQNMKSAKKQESKLLVCNWKTLVTDPKEVKKLLASYLKFAPAIKKNIVVCPPSPFLHLVSDSKLTSGSQSISPELSGATTGLVSNQILKECKVSYVLLGHSEERTRGLTAEQLQQQIKRTLESKFIPLVCIGEKKRDEEGEYFNEFKQQLTDLYKGLTKNQADQIVLAYEPIWAIGAGAKRPATVEEAEEMIIYAQRFIKTNLYPPHFKAAKFLYGGSVNPENAQGFWNSHHINGLLLGRASTEVKTFKQLISSL